MIPLFMLGAAAGLTSLITAALLIDELNYENEDFFETFQKDNFQRTDGSVVDLERQLNKLFFALNYVKNKSYYKSLDIPDTEALTKFRNNRNRYINKVILKGGYCNYLEKMFRDAAYTVLLKRNCEYVNLIINFSPVIKKANLNLKKFGKKSVLFKDISLEVIPSLKKQAQRNIHSEWRAELKKASVELTTCIDKALLRVDCLLDSICYLE